MALQCTSPTTQLPARPSLQLRQRHGASPHPAVARAPALFRLPHLASASAARADRTVCRVRRRVRYDEDEEEEEDEEWGHNEELASLERYSEDARDQALLVKARVDDEVEVVLVFRGFSSSLSGITATDPAMSVLPERAIIQSIDVVKGPFNPNNIEYLEKGVGWNDFKSRLQ